jgi:hypothetical protein
LPEGYARASQGFAVFFIKAPPQKKKEGLQKAREIVEKAGRGW